MGNDTTPESILAAAKKAVANRNKMIAIAFLKEAKPLIDDRASLLSEMKVCNKCKMVNNVQFIACKKHKKQLDTVDTNLLELKASFKLCEQVKKAK